MIEVSIEDTDIEQGDGAEERLPFAFRCVFGWLCGGDPKSNESLFSFEVSIARRYYRFASRAHITASIALFAISMLEYAHIVAPIVSIHVNVGLFAAYAFIEYIHLLMVFVESDLLDNTSNDPIQCRRAVLGTRRSLFFSAVTSFIILIWAVPFVFNSWFMELILLLLLIGSIAVSMVTHLMWNLCMSCFGTTVTILKIVEIGIFIFILVNTF